MKTQTRSVVKEQPPVNHLLGFWLQPGYPGYCSQTHRESFSARGCLIGFEPGGAQKPPTRPGDNGREINNNLIENPP